VICVTSFPHIAGRGAAAWPLAAQAQQPAMPVVGYLSPQSARDDYKDFIVPFLQGLKEWKKGALEWD